MSTNSNSSKPTTKNRKPVSGAPEIISVNGQQPPQQQEDACQADDAPDCDAMAAAVERRAARLAELRAKREAADFIVNSLVKKPAKIERSKGIGRKPITWDADLRLACECAPSPIPLPEHFPVRGPSSNGFFVRDPKDLHMLDCSIAENISADRNDKLLTCVREFIAINLESIESVGAPIAELIDIICEEHPTIQASMAWPGKLVGPQSILDQVANISGRFAILRENGIVRLRKDFKPKKA